jgi:hypothetical protein
MIFLIWEGLVLFSYLGTRKALLKEKGFSGGCSIHIMGGDIVKLLIKQYYKENTMSIVKIIIKE